MANEEFDALSPDLQKRIRRVSIIAAAWFGFIIVNATIFVAFKPYMDRKRKERLARGEPPLARPKVWRQPKEN